MDPAKTASVSLGLPDELRHVPFRDRRHQVSVDETVCDIEAVRAKEQRENRAEHQFRFPADLRPGEGSDGRDEARRDSTLGRSLGSHVSPRQIGGWIEASLTDPETKGPPISQGAAPGRPRPGGPPTSTACALAAASRPRSRRRAKGTLRPTCPRCRARRMADRGNSRSSATRAPPTSQTSVPLAVKCLGASRRIRRTMSSPSAPPACASLGSAAYSGGKSAIVAAST